MKSVFDWLLVLFCGMVLLAGCERGKDDSSPEPCALTGVKCYGNKLVVLGHESKTLSVVDAAKGGALKHIPLSQAPNAVIIHGKKAYVAAGGACGVVEVVDLERGESCGVIPVGHTPAAMAMHGGKLYVACRFDSTVVEVDIKHGDRLRSWPVTREPIGMAVAPDGSKICAVGLLPAERSNGDFTAANLSLIEGEKVTHYPLANGTQGVRGMGMSPDGRYLAIAHVLSRYQVPTTQLDRGWMNTNAVTIVDTQNPDKVYPVLLDDPEAGAANPWAVIFNADGSRLLVTHAGTQELSIIDFAALVKRLKTTAEHEEPVSERLGFLYDLRERVSLPLNGPRSLDCNDEHIYVAGYFSDTVAKVPLNKSCGGGTVLRIGSGVGKSLDRRGEQFFSDAGLCFEGWLSCATCLPDARMDGLNWDLLNVGMGNPKNTRTMFLSHRGGPVMSLGVRASAEVAVKAGFVHIQFTEPTADLTDCVNAYLKNVKEVPGPYLNAGCRSAAQMKDATCAQCHAPGIERGSLSDSARRGKEVFSEAGCAQCHPHPYFTTKEKLMTGTATGADKGKPILVPSLVEVWRTAPYMHDGRAETIREVITEHNKADARGVTSTLSERELQDLINYVLSL